MQDLKRLALTVSTLGNNWQVQLILACFASVRFRDPSTPLSVYVSAMATGSRHGSLSADQLAAVMQAVKEGMRDEISSLKRELASDREAADERLVKKLKLEKAPTFKKKTHEKQFLFNEEVAAKFEGGTACLSEAPPAVEKAKTLLEEGMKLVRERQKLIRMADRSEHGWATVEEYL